jgi:hypothetical protein
MLLCEQEIFLGHLANVATEHAKKKKRKTIQVKDIGMTRMLTVGFEGSASLPFQYPFKVAVFRVCRRAGGN